MDEEKRDGLGQADETVVQAAEETAVTEAEDEDTVGDGFGTVAWPSAWPEDDADEAEAVGEAVDAKDEDDDPKVTILGRDVPRKRLFVAAGVAAAVLLAGIGGCAVLSRRPEPVATETQQQASQATSEETEAEAKTMYVNVGVTAEGWDEATSSPVIAHIESDDGDVDYYHAFSANKAEPVAVGDEPSCKVTYISPVNADGSIYKVGETRSVAASEEKPADTAATTTTLEKVEAGSVTADDLTSIAAQVTEAVKKGDSTLTGDKGSQVVSKVEENIKNSPSATDDVKQSVEQQAGAAQEEAKKEETTAKVPAASGGSSTSGSSGDGGSGGSSSGSGNSGSGQSSSQGGNTSQGGSSQQGSGSQGGNSQSGSSSSQHQHNWVAQTVHHDAVTHTETVHHDAVTHTETVHHDAVTHQEWREGESKEIHVCNGCGQDITGIEKAHAKNALLSGDTKCAGWHGETLIVKPSGYETIIDSPAYDETAVITDQAAWDEVVTITDKSAYDEIIYKCSGCGATK